MAVAGAQLGDRLGEVDEAGHRAVVLVRREAAERALIVTPKRVHLPHSNGRFVRQVLMMTIESNGI